MRSTTSSFHSSSHGDCDTADDRAVATSCTSCCWTIHASAWLLARSSRCASSTRRITGPPRERARNESARASTARAKLPSELIATSPSSGSSAPSGMPAGQVAPETLTTVGIGDVGVPIHRCASAAVTRCVLPTPASPTTSTLRPACTSARTCSVRGRTTSVRRATAPRLSGRAVVVDDETSAFAATAAPLTDEHQDPRPLPSAVALRESQSSLFGSHLMRALRPVSNLGETSVAITDAARTYAVLTVAIDTPASQRSRAGQVQVGSTGRTEQRMASAYLHRARRLRRRSPLDPEGAGRRAHRCGRVRRLHRAQPRSTTRTTRRASPRGS